MRFYKAKIVLISTILLLPIFFISESQADEKCFSSNLKRIAAENITLQKILDTEPEYLTSTGLDANGSEIKISTLNVKRKLAQGNLQINNLQLLICKKTAAEDIEVAEKFPKQSDGFYYNIRMYEEAIKRKNYTRTLPQKYSMRLLWAH